LKCRIANPTGGVDVWTQLGMFPTIETLHITLYDVTGFLRGLDTQPGPPKLPNLQHLMISLDYEDEFPINYIAMLSILYTGVARIRRW
jgi:hypothetical protein